MAAAKKAAAPKATPKTKAAAAPQAPQAEAAAAPAGPAADAGSAAPGADQAAVADAQDGEPDGQNGPQGAALELAEGEVAVSCVKGLDRFYRAGLRFTREPLVLTLADLPTGTLARLEAEPRLIVEKG